MPKMFVHSREGAFTAEARAQVAAALTELGMACESLAATAQVRAGVWVWFTEHEPDAIFSGGQVATNSMICLIVYALEGGLNSASKHRLITEATAILGHHAGLDSSRPPVYVQIQEVPEIGWGMYGEQVRLAALRAGG